MATAHTYLRTHDLAAEHLLIDLAEAGTELHGMVDEGQDRRGVTLVKQAGLSVAGHVRMQVGDDTIEVKDGQLVAFDAEVRHSVEAIEDSTLLLTISDPRN